MGSFPGAFVYPGGGVDPLDAWLDWAVSRQVEEETGLCIDEWTLECLLESVYPSTVLTPVIPIQAHHLVCYYSGSLPDNDDDEDKVQFALCKNEVGGALWLS